MPFARDLYGGQHIRRMRQERQVGQPEQAIFKIDDILVRIQVIARVRVQVREELAGGLRDSPHADKLLIVPGDIAFYGSFEHIHPIGAVAAALIHKDERAAPGRVLHHDIMQVFPHIFCKERRAYGGIACGAELDEIRRGHGGAVEGAVAGFNACGYGHLPVILPPRPFVPHQRGLVEDLLDERRVVPGAEGYHGAKGAVGGGIVPAVSADVPAVEQPGELLTVFLSAQGFYDAEGIFIAVTLCAVLFPLFPAHIFVQRGQEGLCAFLQRLIVDGVPGIGRKTVRDAAEIKLCIIVRVLHVKLPVKAQPFFGLPVLFVGFLFDISRNLGEVILPVNMRPVPADRYFRIAGKAPEERLYIRVFQRFIVNVQEEIAAGDLKAHACRPAGESLHGRHGFVIRHPSAAEFFIRAAGAPIGGERLLGHFTILACCPLPKHPDTHFFQFLHRVSLFVGHPATSLLPSAALLLEPLLFRLFC